MSEGYFPTTLWTEVELAGSGNGDAALAALDNLLKRYERPLLRHLYWKCGLEEDDARDILQSFHLAKILQKHLLTKASRARGPFRAFLAEALVHFATDERRKAYAQKRMPQGGLVSSEDLPKTRNEPVCEDRYAEDWADVTIQRALELMEANARAEEKELHWKLFRCCVFDPIMEGSHRPDVAQLAQEHNLPSTGHVHKAVFDAKKLFAKALRQAATESAGPGGDVEEEIRALIRELSRRSRGGLRI